MRKVTAVLTLTTVGFASAALYLAYALYSRDVAPADAPVATVESASVAGLGQEQVAQDTSAGKPAPEKSARTSAQSSPPTSPGLAATQKNESNEATLMWARPFLARLDDSVQHAALLDETRTGIRRQYSRLKEQLKLSDATFEQLVTQLAEETLQLQEQFARCAVDPQCNVNDPTRRSEHVDHTQEYLALLGANGNEALTQFRNSIGERDQVAQLRGRLPDNNFLPEVQAEQLIKALSDERNLYQQELAQRGVSSKAWGTQLGMVYYPADSGSAEQQVADAQQYIQRMRARAATVLSPAQLAAYTQMQDELLAQLATFLRPPVRKANSVAARST